MPDIDKEKTCCFFGDRKIDETAELKNNLCRIIEDLIVNEKVDTFLKIWKRQAELPMWNAIRK